MNNEKTETEIFLETFVTDIEILGNHDAYGLLRETHEDRANDLLEKSIQYLKEHPFVDDRNIIKIKLYQVLLSGWMNGKKMNKKFRVDMNEF